MITIEILTNMKISMMTMMVMAIINKKKRQVKSNYFWSLHYYIRGSIKQKLSFNQSCCYSMRYGGAGETFEFLSQTGLIILFKMISLKYIP